MKWVLSINYSVVLLKYLDTTWTAPASGPMKLNFVQKMAQQ